MRSIILSVILILFPWSISSAPKTILLIQSFDYSYGWEKSAVLGIKKVIKNKYNLKVFSMNSGGLSAAGIAGKADAAWQEYQKIKPDLVILTNDNALKYLAKRFAKTQTPVVFVGIINNPRYYYKLNAMNITGVMQRPLLRRSIKYQVEFHRGHAQKILVLFDRTETSKIITSKVFKGGNKTKISEMEIDLKMVRSWSQWQHAVKTAKQQKYDAIIVGLYNSLDGGASTEKVIGWMSRNSPVPSFALWGHAVGDNKLIGGLVIFAAQQGEITGKMADKILSGGIDPVKVSPKVRPVYARKGTIVLCEGEMLKYKLNPTTDTKTYAIYIGKVNRKRASSSDNVWAYTTEKQEEKIVYTPEDGKVEE